MLDRRFHAAAQSAAAAEETRTLHGRSVLLADVARAPANAAADVDGGRGARHPSKLEDLLNHVNLTGRLREIRGLKLHGRGAGGTPGRLGGFDLGRGMVCESGDNRMGGEGACLGLAVVGAHLALRVVSVVQVVAPNVLPDCKTERGSEASS